jgi:hypothetical protein
MNLKTRIEIELLRQDNELLREVLDYIDTAGADSEALERLRVDYMALADRYDKMSDIADKYAEISDKLIYNKAA